MEVKEVIHKIENLPKLHEKNDLSYIRRVLTQLDNPQNKVKTIHVTGTNGKGSTSYYISNLLQKAGKKTGLFVSPYIRIFNERIQINGKPISDQKLIEGYLKVEEAIESIKIQDPTFSLVTFEFETALAFWLFDQENCDYAVIEVGIGGEHDKTNVIIPCVSVITTVGLDHEKIIGPTLDDIAHEKSGIIKKRVPVVLGNVPKEVLPIFENKAEHEDTSLTLLGRDFYVADNLKIVYNDSKYKLEFNPRPQAESYDIAIAVQTFEKLGLELSNEDIEDAINKTKIPGRYQVIQKNPLIVLDGAHNIQAMEELLNYIHSLEHNKIYFLVGMMKDKNLDKVFNLFNKEDNVYLTRIDYPRAADYEDFPNFIKSPEKYYSSYQDGFTKLKEKLSSDDILVVTGSFYLVGTILMMNREQDESKKHRK